MFGELPDLVLMISDNRLIKLLELLNSVPRPVFEEEIVDLAAPVDGTKLRDRAKMVAIMEVNEIDELSIQQQSEESDVHQEENEIKAKAEKKSEPIVREQQIQLDLNLNLNEVIYFQQIFTNFIGWFNCESERAKFSQVYRL